MNNSIIADDFGFMFVPGYDALGNNHLYTENLPLTYSPFILLFLGGREGFVLME